MISNALGIARSLARLLRITGEQPQLDLASDLIPVVNAFSLDDAPYHFKRGTVAQFNMAAAGAGTLATIAIGLNAGDTGVGVIRYIVANNRNATAQRFTLNYRSSVWVGGLGLASSFQAPDWDARVRLEGAADIQDRSPLEVRIGSPVGAFANPFWTEDIPANARVTIPGPFVVRRDGFLVCQCDIGNVPFGWGVYADYYES